MATTHVNSANLVLVPTQVELQRIESFLPGIRENASLALCGFGPVAAAALTSRAIQLSRPRRVILAGIAGTFSPTTLPVGVACCFQQVAVDGIGSGEATSFVSANDLGFDHVPGFVAGGPVADTLPLQICQEIRQCDLLLSGCAASDSTVMSRTRQARFPDAAAEDMEGFGVAVACHLAGIPLTILRGISNVVGNRDKQTWDIEQALRATAEALDVVLASINESER